MLKNSINDTVNQNNYLFLFLFLFSCEPFEYSPHVAFDGKTPHKLNEKNILRLLCTKNSDDTIKIIFTGDSQRFYDDAEELVSKANSLLGVDFLIHSGDISDFGLLQEFKWIDKIFSKLKVPYICVVGNHDLVAQGRETYNYMYGNDNFSFVYDSVKFIFHNTNSREYKFNGTVPDLFFLQNELQNETAIQSYVAVSHIPPYDSDFDKNLEYAYAKLFADCNKFLVSLHGHRHDASEVSPYGDGVKYINSNSVDKRRFLVLKIKNNTLIVNFEDY